MINKPANVQAQPAAVTTYAISIHLFASEPNPGVFRILRRICSDTADYPMVEKWNYIVSKRLRLQAAPVTDGLDDIEKLVAGYLLEPEPSTPSDSPSTQISQAEHDKRCEELIKDLARAEVIEVSIPYTSENVGWAARLFPWENALSIVTRRHRTKQLVVVRHLNVANRDQAPLPVLGPDPKVMVIHSSPGELSGKNDFRSETALVKFKLAPSDANFTVMDTPSQAEADAQIKAVQPDVVHLAVLDAHGVSRERPDLLKNAWTSSLPESERGEGIILAGTASPYHVLDPQETADLVAAARPHCPALVSFATCYSAVRIAPMTVAKGAGAAIGFHENLLDAFSFLFFGTFYETLKDEDGDVLKAFQTALKVMWGQPESGSSGVSLWSAVSLVSVRDKPVITRKRTKASRSNAVGRIALDDEAVRTVFTVKCEPLAKVNYCSLHNGRDLFTCFSIEKIEPGLVPTIEVRVELTAETETAAWRHSFRFDEAPGMKGLGSLVRLPLGARALRRVQESTRSGLFVEIRCGGHVLYQQSCQVTLVPVDEWRDTDEDRRWLPSFVLPRDPAIRRIMAAADSYLRTLCDDSSAGFDGYQSAAQWPEKVDYQARAIWCALLYDFHLGYINPPPTYNRVETGISQRMRTPSQILEEGRGTCIDLALLFASCLEYVGIYPVIFLISGHAFPGWWRDEASYQGFSGFRFVDVSADASGAQSKTAPEKDKFALWMVTGINGFRELVTPLREGSLAAIESTMVCSSGAFEAALQLGRENLADSAIFDAMVNVHRAREGDNPVTPLPIVGDPFLSATLPA